MNHNRFWASIHHICTIRGYIRYTLCICKFCSTWRISNQVFYADKNISQFKAVKCISKSYICCITGICAVMFCFVLFLIIITLTGVEGSAVLLANIPDFSEGKLIRQRKNQYRHKQRLQRDTSGYMICLTMTVHTKPTSCCLTWLKKAKQYLNTFQYLPAQSLLPAPVQNLLASLPL